MHSIYILSDFYCIFMSQNKNLYKLLALVLLVLVYMPVLLPTVKVANDLHYATTPDLLSNFSLPQTWGSGGAVGMGEYAVSVLWNWPINFFFSLWAKVGVPFQVTLSLFGFLAFLLIGFFSIVKLLGYYKIGKEGKTAGTLFFLLNTYILLLVDGGQLNLAVAYTLVPLNFYLFLKVLKDVQLPTLLLSSLFVVLMGFFDIRVLYIFALLVACHYILSLASGSFKAILSKTFQYLRVGLGYGVVFLLANVFWLLPSFYGRPPSLPDTYGRVSQIQFLDFTTIGHSITLLQPHWYKNVFGKVTDLKPGFVLLPLLAFAAPLLSKTNRKIAFWLFVALVSVFLTKGVNPPLGSVYTWLFTNVPGFSLFRDSTKFYFLAALSYSLLIGFTSDEMVKKLQKNSHKKKAD